MKKFLTVVSVSVLAVSQLFAGNPDRRGESGAPELNMNGYGRSAGLWAMNVAGVRGLEAERLNPAGLAMTRKIEVLANYTTWLTGSGVNMVQAGYAQRIKTNALALSFQSVNFGAIPITTTESPEGGLGTFRPNFFNIGLSYAKNFRLGTSKILGANIITGGITFRYIYEGASSITANGFSADMGLQYTTGKRENIHFGVSLRNIGTPLKFKGDALTVASYVNSSYYRTTLDKQTNKLDLPVQLNIGISYDAYFGQERDLGNNKVTKDLRLTPMFQFESNAFGNDHYGFGAEFAFREIFMLRAAYRIEKGVFKTDTRQSAFNGLAAGASFEFPFKKDNPTGPSIGIDYAYRMNGLNLSFKGTHTVGLRINLGGPDKEKEFKKEEETSFTTSNSASTSSSSKKKSKGAKVSVEELEAKQAELDSIMRVNQELKVKAETPIIKIDTVVQTKVEEKIVTKIDTVIINNSSVVKTEVVKQDGKTLVKFTDTRPVMFETGSSKLTASSYTYLNEVSRMMKSDYVSSKLILAGYTDNKGDETKNVKLSQDRVDAVKAYLVSKGVAADRIPNPKGYGSANPVSTNETEAGRAANRRVELSLEM